LEELLRAERDDLPTCAPSDAGLKAFNLWTPMANLQSLGG
jgi:hypothetical protein